MSEFNPAFPGRLNCKNLRFTDVDTLSTEQILFDGYWEELINLYGVGLAYQVCRYDVTKADNLYGEHVSQAYADPVEILGLINLQENAVALSKYGFVTDDSITLYLHNVVSKVKGSAPLVYTIFPTFISNSVKIPELSRI